MRWASWAFLRSFALRRRVAADFFAIARACSGVSFRRLIAPPLAPILEKYSLSSLGFIA
jgi:hypothetical protein